MVLIIVLSFCAYVPWCKTLLTCKTVSQTLPTDKHFDLAGCLEMHFQGISVLCGLSTSMF